MMRNETENSHGSLIGFWYLLPDILQKFCTNLTGTQQIPVPVLMEAKQIYANLRADLLNIM